MARDNERSMSKRARDDSSGERFAIDRATLDIQRVRREREDGIRRQSEQYGSRWCSEHAHALGRAVADWTTGRDVALKVRVYDRKSNAMHEVPLADVFEAMPKDLKIPLRPTAFGQVILSPTMHLSANVYQLLVALRALDL